jgi:hypothetical protein
VLVAVVAVVAIVVAALLMDFAYHCADTRTCGSADKGSLKAAAEEGAENGTAACADESAFAGADSALILITIPVVTVVVVAIVVVAAVVVVVTAAATAVAHSVIEVRILISILGAGSHRQEACGQHERGDEYSFSYLHHAGFDAGLIGRVRIFSLVGEVPSPGGTFRVKSSFFLT